MVDSYSQDRIVQVQSSSQTLASFEEAFLMGRKDKGRPWFLGVLWLPVGLDSDPLLIFAFTFFLAVVMLFTLHSPKTNVCVLLPGLPPTEPTKAENK